MNASSDRGDVLVSTFGNLVGRIQIIGSGQGHMDACDELIGLAGIPPKAGRRSGTPTNLVSDLVVANELGIRFYPSPHFAPKVKRVIYLFQSGAPSQYELFDHKPFLKKMHISIVD